MIIFISLLITFNVNQQFWGDSVNTGVNFINIIHTRFSYERHFSSYILALLKNSYEKRTRIRLMKLATGFPRNSR